MTIKVNNCGDCIFRESHYDFNNMGYDMVDSCILLSKLNAEYTSIAVYRCWDEIKNIKELNERLENCPLDKEQITIML